MTDEIVTITYEDKVDKYHWHVSYGHWQIRGYGIDLADAEKHAHDTIRGIPNHGVVHSIYVGGKPVVPVQE